MSVRVVKTKMWGQTSLISLALRAKLDELFLASRAVGYCHLFKAPKNPLSIVVLFSHPPFRLHHAFWTSHANPLSFYFSWAGRPERTASKNFQDETGAQYCGGAFRLDVEIPGQETFQQINARMAVLNEPGPGAGAGDRGGRGHPGPEGPPGLCRLHDPEQRRCDELAAAHWLKSLPPPEPHSPPLLAPS